MARRRLGLARHDVAHAGRDERLEHRRRVAPGASRPPRPCAVDCELLDQRIPTRHARRVVRTVDEEQGAPASTSRRPGDAYGGEAFLAPPRASGVAEEGLGRRDGDAGIAALVGAVQRDQDVLIAAARASTG